MAVFSKRIILNTQGNCDIVEITEAVERAVVESSLKKGIATVFVPGATGSITTVEPEPGMMQDLIKAIEKLVPEVEVYQHDRAYGDGNGHSHVRASLLGPSMTIPFEPEGLTLGTWQKIVFIDFDNRPRNRNIIIQIVGE